MDSKTFHVHMTCHLCNREVNYPMTCHRKDTEEGSLWECCNCRGHGFLTIEEIDFKCCSQMREEEQQRYLSMTTLGSYYYRRFNIVQ